MGGAVGDAMGAPFEGLWSDDVPNSGSLVSSFHECHGYPAGQYTDDTQLTIATIQSVDQRFDLRNVNLPQQPADFGRCLR